MPRLNKRMQVAGGRLAGEAAASFPVVLADSSHHTLDRPFASMVADYQRTGDGRFIWPAHFAGITREYCQIEKLANLDKIPRPHGFYVSCLPVKIEGASAGWCRAVALVPEG